MARSIRRPGAHATLAGDRRGGVAVLIGVVLVALIGMIALAIDVSSAVSGHTRLRQAADTAALAAVREAAILTANNSNAALGPAQDAGYQRFAAQSSSIPGVSLTSTFVDVRRENLTITATVSFEAKYATQLAYMLNGMSSSFGNLASLTLSDRAAAQQTVGAYVDLMVLMDTSNSMTIGATQQDRNALAWASTYIPIYTNPSNYVPNYNRPYDYYGWQGCTFACHITFDYGWKTVPIPAGNGSPFPPNLNTGPDAKPPLGNSTGDLQTYYQQAAQAYYAGQNYFPGTMGNNGGSTFVSNQSRWPAANDSGYNPVTYDPYALARWLGVTMRIDLLKSATTSIATAIAQAPDPEKFRFGLYTFDMGVTQRYALNPASGISDKIDKVEVSTFPWPSGYPAQTQVGQGVKDFTDQYVAPAGDGSSPDQSRKYVVIMTDGMEDYLGSSGNRAMTVFNPATCLRLTKPIANGGLGAGVFVLQAVAEADFTTAATDENGNASGMTVSQTFNASVAAMQACASNPTYYFLASSPTDVKNATQKIIDLALSQATVLTLASPPPPQGP